MVDFKPGSTSPGDLARFLDAARRSGATHLELTTPEGSLKVDLAPMPADPRAPRLSDDPLDDSIEGGVSHG